MLLPVYYYLLENHWTIPYVGFGSIDPDCVLNRNLCLGEYINESRGVEMVFPNAENYLISMQHGIFNCPPAGIKLHQC